MNNSTNSLVLRFVHNLQATMAVVTDPSLRALRALDRTPAPAPAPAPALSFSAFVAELMLEQDLAVLFETETPTTMVGETEHPEAYGLGIGLPLSPPEEEILFGEPEWLPSLTQDLAHAGQVRCLRALRRCSTIIVGRFVLSPSMC